jgi:glycosyltransferase involved in cell wall biosynthesis
MRRLLMVSAFYPPLAGGGVHRVLSFTRYLPAHGWACTVVCMGEHDYWVRDESLLARVPEGTEVIRVRGGSGMAAWLRMRRGARGGRRSGRLFSPLRALADWWLLPDSYVGWARHAARVAADRAGRGDVDVVLSTSPPDSAHLAGRVAARASGRPWVADFRDPWVGLHFRRPPTGWHRRLHAALEAEVTGGADLVLAASRTHADELRARTSAVPRRLLHLPNGFEPDPGAGTPAGSPDRFRLVFTGTLSLMEDAGTLLQAVAQVLAAEPAAREVLAVEFAGPYDRDWEARVSSLGLAGVVRFHGPLAHAEARALQRAADLLLLWKPHGEGYRTMVPGKLYEYLDTGRPLLALLEPDDEAADWVRRGGGWVGPPGDAAALATEIVARLARWRREGRASSQRPVGLEEHTRAALAGRLAHALDALVEAR